VVFSPDDSSDDKILEVFEDEFMVIYNIAYVCTNIWEVFDPNEVEDGGQGEVDDHNHGANNVFYLLLFLFLCI
jgi:hypothetical protein